MIQIDMKMPEKCDNCIFCGDSCNCVASEYDGLGINVGCAFRTGRRDIRCPLKEQETTSIVGSRIFQCEKCGYGIDDIYLSNEHDFDVYPKYCPNCGRQVKWE